MAFKPAGESCKLRRQHSSDSSSTSVAARRTTLYYRHDENCTSEKLEIGSRGLEVEEFEINRGDGEVE